MKKALRETEKHCACAGCTKVRTPPARRPATNTHHPTARTSATHPQTGPITIHRAAASYI